MKINGKDVYVVGDDQDKYYQIYKQSNSYGDDVTAFLSKVVKDDWVCLDVGANIGLTTIHMILCASRVQVYAFEPSKRNIEYLLENVKPFAVEITPVLTAVGDEEGVLKFAELADFGAGSHVLEGQGYHPSVRDDMIIEVPVVTLDKWAGENSIEKLDLIKIDVEGYELNVLDGARGILKQFNSMVMLEFNNWFIIEVQKRVPAEVFDHLRGVFKSIYRIDAFGELHEIENSEDGRAGFLDYAQKAVVSNLLCRS